MFWEVTFGIQVDLVPNSLGLDCDAKLPGTRSGSGGDLSFTVSDQGALAFLSYGFLQDSSFAY